MWAKSIALGYWREGNARAAANLRDDYLRTFRGWDHNYVHSLLEHSSLALKGHIHDVKSASPDCAPCDYGPL